MACNDCNNNEKMEKPAQIPYIVYESEMARVERSKNEEVARHMRDKRNWMIAFFVALALFFATNVGWLIYESQFVTISCQQDGEGTNIIGDDNEVNNGAENQNPNTEEAAQE